MSSDAVQTDSSYSPVQDVVDQYGLACTADTKAGYQLADTRSATPELLHEKVLPSRRAIAPAARCGLGFRLCHSSLGKLSVDKILPGGAAEQEGSLKRGDQILSINGHSTADLIDAEEVARVLVGDVGSVVNLRVQRAGAVNVPLEVQLERRMFEGQFDSIHSGPPPEEDEVAEGSQERPHSMPNASAALQDGFDPQIPPPIAPHSAPMPTKLDSSASTENSAMLLQELDRAIKRMTPLTIPDQNKSPTPWRSETPIEVLLAKYTTCTSPGALSSSPPALSARRGAVSASPSSHAPALTDLPTAQQPVMTPSGEAEAQNAEPKDDSMPLVCRRCQCLYLKADIEAARPGMQGLKCCVNCSPPLNGESAVTTAGLDRRSWGLAQILGQVPEDDVRDKVEGETGRQGGHEAASAEKSPSLSPGSIAPPEVRATTEQAEDRASDAAKSLFEDAVSYKASPSQDDGDTDGMPSNPAQPLTAPAVLKSAMTSSEHAAASGKTQNVY